MDRITHQPDVASRDACEAARPDLEVKVLRFKRG